MYDKFSKGETIKNEAIISSSFPSSQDIELWNNEEQRKYEAHIAALIQELARKEHELEDKNQQLMNRDKRILELGN